MKQIQANKLPKIIFLITLVVMFTSGFGQNIPQRPNPPRLVNDFAHILTPQQANNLEKKLVNFNDTTSNQITIVTVNSLDGYEPSMYAYEIGAKWRVGQKKFDNGIVILIKPKLNSSDRGRAFIAVGYGLEPAIPDATAKRIVENEMIPNFKNGNYFKGINKATTVLMKMASGEISSQDYKKHTSKPAIFSFIPFFIIIIIIILIRKNGGKSHGIGGSSGRSSSLWTALMLGSMMGGGSGSGSWGNFSGGSSGFGGGGGFGGFGGGSFGGGGAGGSW